MKSTDVFNRRQPNRGTPKLGIHDVFLSRYFQIKGHTWRYSLKERSSSNSYAVFVETNEGIECIGFAKPDRNKIIISVRRDGIDWTSSIKLSDIEMFGMKTGFEEI
jgi:hypothetical protein